MQSENYKQQVIELRNELQQKESELVAAKQESESVKRQSKTDGVIPTTKKDAEMTKMLVGTWNEYCDYFSWRNRELPTRTKIAVSNYKCVFSGDGKYSERGTFRAINGDVMLDNSIILGEGQSESIVSEGKWWVKDGYLYVRTANDTSGMEILFINQQEYKISDDRRLAVGVRSR